jgi:hypothetical protein
MMVVMSERYQCFMSAGHGLSSLATEQTIRPRRRVLGSDIVDPPLFLLVTIGLELRMAVAAAEASINASGHTAGPIDKGRG